MKKAESLEGEILKQVGLGLEEGELLERKKIQKDEEYKKLLQEMEHKAYWHTCEVCGKKELLTSAQANTNGWDYPPTMGTYGVVGPRTCGECSINQTLWWKLANDVIKSDDLVESDKEILERILLEPWSLFENENT